MAKLMKLKDWVEKTFDSNVSLRTAQNWAQNGQLSGAKKIGKLWFVDPEIEANTTGNELVDQVLAYGSSQS